VDWLPNGGYSKADCGAHAVDAHIPVPPPSQSVHLGDSQRFCAEFRQEEIARVSWDSLLQHTLFRTEVTNSCPDDGQDPSGRSTSSPLVRQRFRECISWLGTLKSPTDFGARHRPAWISLIVEDSQSWAPLSPGSVPPAFPRLFRFERSFQAVRQL
jgi:hypothetical protein